MKKSILFLMLMIGVTLFVGCEKTTYDESDITYYVAFDMAGEAVMMAPVGTGFTDPGVTASEAGVDVTADMVVEGSINPDEVGQYIINYSAVNVDGFSSSVTRTVYIYDPAVTTDIAGKYTSQAGSWYVSTARNRAGKTIELVKLCPGVFSIECVCLNFWVEQYGYSSMKTSGIIKLNADNTIELLSSFNKYWSDSCSDFSNGTYDPVTKTIEYDYEYAYPGHSILTLN